MSQIIRPRNLLPPVRGKRFNADSVLFATHNYELASKRLELHRSPICLLLLSLEATARVGASRPGKSLFVPQRIPFPVKSMSPSSAGASLDSLRRRGCDGLTLQRPLLFLNLNPSAPARAAAQEEWSSPKPPLAISPGSATSWKVFHPYSATWSSTVTCTCPVLGKSAAPILFRIRPSPGKIPAIFA